MGAEDERSSVNVVNLMLSLPCWHPHFPSKTFSLVIMLFEAVQRIQFTVRLPEIVYPTMLQVLKFELSKQETR